MPLKKVFNESVELLKQLISIPSFSREEDMTAEAISEFLTRSGIKHSRYLNNVWAANKHFNPSKRTLLLNSHHDTVRPDSAYKRDPFEPVIEDDKLYGLGSNDAGGSVVSMIAAFRYLFNEPDLPVNIIVAITAEEEISGSKGIESFLGLLTTVDMAIVGEPTGTDVAVAEKGLIVLDCIASGVRGHVTRNDGDNALYKAMDDIDWIRNYRFDRVSEMLGETRMAVTVLNTANTTHNIIPAECSFVVDVRVTDEYTLEEVVAIVKANVQSYVRPRSLRLKPSSIPLDHELVVAATALGKKLYGSPTTSDQALMPFPSIKCGPGETIRSHMADEYILLSEIMQGIDTYIGIINNLEHDV
jgi:acetylornithine deacetylase/succinyl-diaminopimelate desuccinylase-like protein